MGHLLPKLAAAVWFWAVLREIGSQGSLRAPRRVKRTGFGVHHMRAGVPVRVQLTSPRASVSSPVKWTYTPYLPLHAWGALPSCGDGA